jgi:hypothetical protein
MDITPLHKVATIILFFTLTLSCAQKVKTEVKEATVDETKMEQFVSKKGQILKFVDTTMPGLRLSYGSAETRIRKLSSGSESAYFYQIEKAGQYSSSVASIEYTDLVEVIKAISALKSEVNKDVAANPDYLENRFVSDDGFIIGYYISKGKSSWFIRLDGHGSDNTLFLNDVMTLEDAFNNAKIKIEGLRK